MTPIAWKFEIVMAELPKEDSAKQFIRSLEKLAFSKFGKNVVGIGQTAEKI